MLDGKELALVEALPRIVGCGMGTVLCCLPGRLTFVETEDERLILERHDPLEKQEYICFVIGRKDEDSHVERGIFQAVAQALEWQNIKGSGVTRAVVVWPVTPDYRQTGSNPTCPYRRPSGSLEPARSCERTLRCLSA